MRNICIGLIAISTLNIACKKDERATYIKEEAATSQSGIALNSPSKTALMDQAGIQSNSNPTPIATVPGMNPPHGQPGHRCDIQVGQPLNSSPAPSPTSQNITVNGNNTIQIDPSAIAAGKATPNNNGQPIKTAPGMNPPHGQPGHRCDIPVGQPLNSKSNNTTSVNTVQTTPTPAPAEQNLAMGDKPKVNPAHGEPWHDCSLKVGDPFP
ncbi:hypothetical protein [Chryseobacterium sp. PMSZPI]|uniref:hypothetical protein n=1 Tax=Chryseobacterium sp. PMSZPI TaxID=1033900 RepID=UPI000C331E40|nr:hypothetical protein [Chryseobacterium sp. PMSZPI]PKF75353.1 hypothetical protein CW752_04515 [Chryseobacterium sp. PMSZPI]